MDIKAQKAISYRYDRHSIQKEMRKLRDKYKKMELRLRQVDLELIQRDKNLDLPKNKI
jgi:hypothetical protein